MSFIPPESGHADDLLSAVIDGEATPDEATWVRAHLDECPACRDEHAVVSEARQALRGLPALDATPVVDAYVARHRSIVRTGMVFVGAVAIVVGALAVTAAVLVEPVAPDVESLVALHAMDDPAAGAAMPAATMQPVDRVRGPYVAPPAVAPTHGLARHAVYDGDDLTRVIYESSSTRVSVFQIPGRIDWSAIDDGTTVELEGRSVWRRDGSPTVLMARAGHLVVVVVSDDEAAAYATLAEIPESRRDAWSHHLHDAGARLAEVFSFGG